jgi:hypothetical protein
MKRKNSLRINLGEKYYNNLYQKWYQHLAHNDNEELNISFKNFLRVLKWTAPYLFKYRTDLESIFKYTRTNNDEDVFWVGKGDIDSNE